MCFPDDAYINIKRYLRMKENKLGVALLGKANVRLAARKEPIYPVVCVFAGHVSYSG